MGGSKKKSQKNRLEHKPVAAEKPEKLLSDGVMWLLAFLTFMFLVFGGFLFYTRPWER